MAGATITADFQVEWDGHLITGMVRDGQSGLSGWDDLPGLDFGDADRPNADGAWPGRVLAQSRHITWRFRGRLAQGQMGSDLALLRKVLAVTQDERPLVIRTLDEVLMCWARIEQRVIPTDGLFSVGRPSVTVQWVAADPRRYSTLQHNVGLTLPTPPVGIAWPFTWPVTWDDTESSSGQATVENAGDADSPPFIVIAGPVATPSVTNASTGKVLEFDLTLGAGEALQLDVRTGTATLGGSDRSMYVSTRSVPVPDFLLAPGDNTLAFHSPSTAGGGDAAASISWRDSYL